MKKLFTLSVTALFTLAVPAQFGNSILNLRLENNARFVAWLDGRQIAQASNKIIIENLVPGNHLLKVALIQSSLFGKTQTKTIFNSNIKVVPNSNIYAHINRNNQLVIERSVALNKNNSLYPNGSARNNRGKQQPHTPQVAPAIPIIDVYTFNQLKNTINNTAFESTKLSVLQQASPYYYFNTFQVQELLRLFSFESTKLNVAKMLFDRTIDKQNYFLVNQEFAYGSSVNELYEYIAQL